MLFLILLRYTRSLDEVLAQLPAHRDYLDRHFAAGRLLFSGPRIPRDGGVILCRAETQEQARGLAEEDPFLLSGVADAEIVAFEASNVATGLEALLAPAPSP